ncbi:MAG: GGDEF domain-containing protein [Campylobacterota bacterium]|nr:GGDEF domain-containing protein [Campylobacterota bacterium]
MSLSDVTSLALSDLLSKDIVLPSEYQEIFVKHAINNDVLLNDDAYVLNHNEASIKKANDLLQNANQNIVKLSDTTKNAQKAMEEEDHEKLILVTKEVSKLRHEMQLLKSRIYKDPLTGVNNRLWINDIYLEGKSDFKNSGALIFIDLDNFKLINDTYGHNVGDRVLVFISRYLDKAFNAFKFIRFAGDEFIMLSDDTDIERLKITFEESRQGLTKKKIKANNGDLLKLDFSFGIAPFGNEDSFRDVVEKADALMYEHKQSRR